MGCKEGCKVSDNGHMNKWLADCLLQVLWPSMGAQFCHAHHSTHCLLHTLEKS